MNTKKKITIVTAFHHCIGGIDKNKKVNCWLSESDDKSIKVLEEFMSKIPDRFEVSIKSSENIDDDFIYLCRAHELILSTEESGFGKIARIINNIVKQGHTLPVPPLRRPKKRFNLLL